MKDRMAEARYRIYAISEHLLVDMWNAMLDPKIGPPTWRGRGLEGYVVSMLKAEGIPELAVVDSVHHDWMNRTLMFRVWHESFDIVPDGERPPVVSAAQVGVVSRVVLSEVQDIIVGYE